LDPIFKNHFHHLNKIQLDQLDALLGLYKEWNEKINVISRKDIENLNLHHVLHSLSIAKFISFKPGTNILDLGTGGGFPGIPLAIVFPEVQFELVDGKGKKLKVIDDIVERLGLKNVITKHDRAEYLKSKYHFIVSRAVASLDKLVFWSENLIHNKQINAFPNGLISLKGGKLKEEIKSIPSFLDPELIHLKDYFDHPYYDEKHLIYIPI
jgi:16S rRNA (guanine527-N7)-methyltransferase